MLGLYDGSDVAVTLVELLYKRVQLRKLVFAYCADGLYRRFRYGALAVRNKTSTELQSHLQLFFGMTVELLYLLCVVFGHVLGVADSDCHLLDGMRSTTFCCSRAARRASGEELTGGAMGGRRYL